MGERPQNASTENERPAQPIAIEHGPEPPRLTGLAALALAAASMPDVQLALRSRYIPTLTVDMSSDVRTRLTKDAAETITEYLDEKPRRYDGFGGLARLINDVSEATSWPKADLYTIALRAAQGIQFNSLQGTVKRI